MHFSVTDTGIGIPEDKRASIIFEALRRLTPPRPGNTEAPGWVSQCRPVLVALMGGRIWLESMPGVGSTFHFTARFEAARGLSGCAGACGTAATSIDLPVLWWMTKRPTGTSRRNARQAGACAHRWWKAESPPWRRFDEAQDGRTLVPLGIADARCHRWMVSRSWIEFSSRPSSTRVLTILMLTSAADRAEIRSVQGARRRLRTSSSRSVDGELLEAILGAGGKSAPQTSSGCLPVGR